MAARIAGRVFVRFGQPAVIGEMTAGILLGPSLLGWLLPDTFLFVFPKESFGVLQLFSQIGVCVFMFVVGLELDVANLRLRAQTAVVVSHSSIMVPLPAGRGLIAAAVQYIRRTGHVLRDLCIVHGHRHEHHGVSRSRTQFSTIAVSRRRRLARPPRPAPLSTTPLRGPFSPSSWRWRGRGAGSDHRQSGSSDRVRCGHAGGCTAGTEPAADRGKDAWRQGAGSHRDGAGLHDGPRRWRPRRSASTALFGAFLAGVVMPRNKAFHEYLTLRLENSRRSFCFRCSSRSAAFARR